MSAGATLLPIGSNHGRIFGRSGIVEIIEDLLEMPERRNEPLPIFSMDGDEGHRNPDGKEGKDRQRILGNDFP